MTDVIAVSLISGLFTMGASSIAAYAAWRATKISKKNADAIHEVHLTLNSRLSELIAASHAKGQIEERDNQRAVEANGKPDRIEP